MRATAFDQQRTFDDAGNVATATTTLPGGTDNQAFCYDEQDRLTWAGSTGTPPCQSLTVGTLSSAAYSQTFAYDLLGRMTSGPLGSYSYDPNHLHAANAIGSTYTAAYDAAGNMTCRAPSSATTCTGTQTGAQLAYNAQGTLVAWHNAPSSPSTTAGFLYDAEGNRVEQQVTQNGTTTTTVYVGNLEEDKTTGTITSKTTFYYANGQRIATGLNQSASPPGPISYLASDALGTVNVAVKASDSSTSATLFAPYGAARYSSGSMPTDYGFTGQHADSSTGLDYYNARYYDPVAGQFGSADSVVLQAGGFDILGLSRYAYVEGNPINRNDPSGNTNCFIGDGDPCVNSHPTGDSGGSGGTAPTYIPPGLRETDPVPGLASPTDHDSQPSQLEQLWSGFGGFLYDPPVCVPGLCENAIAMHLLNSVPQDQQDAVIMTMTMTGVGAPEATDLSIIRFLGLMPRDPVPTAEFSRSLAPGLARNFDAWRATGEPTRLNRVSAAVRDANRRAALRGQKPAPPGMSLDEFPFACSAQGGEGSCVSAVPVWEQNCQGGILSSFFQRFGIGDGDPFDVKFTP